MNDLRRVAALGNCMLSGATFVHSGPCNILDVTTVKSCIKAVAYVQFFNFLVRLLFKCGFYLRATYMPSPDSAKPVKAVLHM